MSINAHCVCIGKLLRPNFLSNGDITMGQSNESVLDAATKPIDPRVIGEMNIHEGISGFSTRKNWFIPHLLFWPLKFDFGCWILG